METTLKFNLSTYHCPRLFRELFQIIAVVSVPLRIVRKPKKILRSSSTSIIKVVAGVKKPYSRESFFNKQQYTYALNVSNILDDRFNSAFLDYLKAQWIPKNRDLS